MPTEAQAQDASKLGTPAICGCGYSLGVGYLDMPAEARERMAKHHRLNCATCYEARKNAEAKKRGWTR